MEKLALLVFIVVFISQTFFFQFSEPFARERLLNSTKLPTSKSLVLSNSTFQPCQVQNQQIVFSNLNFQAEAKHLKESLVFKE